MIAFILLPILDPFLFPSTLDDNSPWHNKERIKESVFCFTFVLFIWQKLTNGIITTRSGIVIPSILISGSNNYIIIAVILNGSASVPKSIIGGQ